MKFTTIIGYAAIAIATVQAEDQHSPLVVERCLRPINESCHKICTGCNFTVPGAPGSDYVLERRCLYFGKFEEWCIDPLDVQASDLFPLWSWDFYNFCQTDIKKKGCNQICKACNETVTELNKEPLGQIYEKPRFNICLDKAGFAQKCWPQPSPFEKIADRVGSILDGLDAAILRKLLHIG
ncbi:hypothetical protein TWF694_000391 [Orbilia ellipsospora]|uniref:Uncharacterized protein n=1 Tax=Orbilia ellipsospora TaxID=2528407 RepID=A0AAV9XQ78_9PEZI